MSALFTTKPLTEMNETDDSMNASVHNDHTVISFSFLSPEDYHRIKPIFDSNNTELPLKAASQIAIAEDESTHEIVGFFCYQLVPHAEPMWIDEKYRDVGIWAKLVEMIYPLTERRTTFVIATTPDVEEMCKRIGLTKVDHPVYVKEKI